MRNYFLGGVLIKVGRAAKTCAVTAGIAGQINADPDVRFVTHLGDIKNASSVCSDEYFNLIYKDFALFRDPLVYTPGDNEWTACHRANNGRYNPLERLAAIRETFFSRPGKTLGQQSVAVKAQPGFPENVRYTRNGVSFAALNIPGSNNSMLPWDGLGLTAPTAQQVAEVTARTSADIALIRETFARAKSDRNRAVVCDHPQRRYASDLADHPDHLSLLPGYLGVRVRSGSPYRAR